MAAAVDISLRGILSAKSGLMQIVADNFDTDIYSVTQWKVVNTFSCYDHHAT
jgi:hypothetical protein